MATILYLAHRLPYPPDKGDKVRTHHVLRHLHERHRVLLGTFVDDTDDLRHVPMVSNWCSESNVVPLTSPWAHMRALSGLLGGKPLTLGYYRDRRMQRWVDRVRHTQRVDAVLVSSSSMAGYAQGFDAPVLMDFIDVDSAKWGAYAAMTRGPLAWLYRREARHLLAFERRTALASSKSFFVTRREAELFAELAPECATAVRVLGNGVDSDFFSHSVDRPCPYAAGEVPLVFTGTMNYRPNVDAIVWFAREVLPLLKQSWPAVRLSVVGRHPAPAVLALVQDGVRVTGGVDDVRPWLQHAAVVVAPMRLARGLQNKILEAMAMARPVVAARACAEALQVQPGTHLAVATTAAEYASEVEALLSEPARAQAMGQSARRHVQEMFSWPATLAPLDECLENL